MDKETKSAFVIGIDDPAEIKGRLLDIAVDSWRAQAGYIPDTLPADHVSRLSAQAKRIIDMAITCVRSLRMSGRTDEQNMERIKSLQLSYQLHFSVRKWRELIEIIYPMKNPGELAGYIEELDNE